MPKQFNSFLANIAKRGNLASISAFTVTTAVLGWIATKSKGEENKAKKRRWSLFSESLAHGAFPPTSKFNEAIINAVMTFDDDDRPTVKEIVDHCVKSLLKYERFSSVFDRKNSLVSYRGDKLDPFDLVRVVPVSECSTDEDLLQVMENQACVPLAQAPRGTVLPWWEFILLQNTNKSKNKRGKSAVVWRVHHSLGKKLL